MAPGGRTVASTGALESRLSPGSSFGRYVVDSRLARGGMGEVWLATARGPGGFQKRVVIKTVLPDLVEKPGYVQMLVREASLAARLDHPNIVHVFDLGCVGGMYYIAMEYLSGRSLAQMLRRSHDLGQRLPLRVLLTMIAISCDGLQYAHDYADDDGRPLGMLHRDLSPSNIMLTFAGRVALLDFGVATAAHGQYKTRSGTIKGKFHYLAPERVRGEPSDRRSDIYSLGVVLYQCLTLRWPFRAQNEYELLRQIAHDTPPPVRHYAPWVTARLEQIILRAMANEASTRQQQARDLAADLRDYLRAIGAVVEPSELVNCLAGLYPEAPEVMARRLVAAPLSRPDDAGPGLDDGIEIIFQPSEASEASQQGEPTELDQPDPVVLGAGSPVMGGSRPTGTGATAPAMGAAPLVGATRAPDAAAPDGSPLVGAGTAPDAAAPDGAPLAGAAIAAAIAASRADLSSIFTTGAASIGGRRYRRPRATSSPLAEDGDAAAPSRAPAAALDADLDVDIFPEPTRSIPPLGGDVFGGYGSRARPSERARNEPAFVGGRSDPPRDSSAWPWARRVERAERASGPAPAPDEAAQPELERDEAG